MNIVHAWGGNKKRRKLAEDVVNFCIQELMPRMRTLDICIDITNDCPNCGYCLAVDKREFVIEVKNCKDTLEFVETICHECVHVAQYAQGRLDINGKMEYKTQEEYENVWYEKEAYQLEGRLLTKFYEL